MVPVDSALWIGYFNGRSSAKTYTRGVLLGADLAVLGDLFLTDVLQGFRTDRVYRTARELLDPLDLRALSGRRIALAAAENNRALRRSGVTLRRIIEVMIPTCWNQAYSFCAESSPTR